LYGFCCYNIAQYSSQTLRAMSDIQRQDTNHTKQSKIFAGITQWFYRKCLDQLIDTYDSYFDNASILASATIPMLHDIAVPISIIEGELINSKINNPTIKEAVINIKEMILTVKLMLRAELTAVKFDISYITTQTLSLMEILISGRGVDLNIHIAKGLTISGSPTLYRRILSNLIINAVEAHIANTATKQVSLEIQHRFIDVILQPGDKGVTLSISDNAGGIDPSTIRNAYKHATDKHYILHNSQHLGLTAVIYIIQTIFKGTISINSKPRIGTEISIFLPTC